MRYLTIILSLIALPVFSQNDDWNVPENKAKELSYFKFNNQTVAIGKNIYDLNCKSCHGDPGKGNFQKLNPLPPDPATEKMQKNTDGELHYKITQGFSLMPSFKSVLSSDDIWNVISYIRSFNDGYVQQVGEKIVLTGFTGELQFSADFNEKENTLEFKLFDKVGEKLNPVNGADINLFAKRNFGNLKLDNTQTTNAEGIAVFNLPEDLPGDTIGMIHLVAKLLNQDAFGDVELDTALQAGVPVHPVSLRAKRAMWNVFQMAPVWLLISYFGVVIGIWSFIFYVIYHFREIYLIGKMQEEQNDSNHE